MAETTCVIKACLACILNYPAKSGSCQQAQKATICSFILSACCRHGANASLITTVDKHVAHAGPVTTTGQGMHSGCILIEQGRCMLLTTESTGLMSNRLCHVCSLYTIIYISNVYTNQN